MSLRHDRAPIQNYEKLADGRLRVRASFSRVGALQYLRADGSIQTEIVSPDELFKTDSLETAALAPVTLGHPPVGMVTPKNWREYAVGASGSTVTARQDEGLVDVVFLIGDESAINAVESGRANQVSAGYYTELETRSDGIYQTNRRYNHLALVERGRAGPDVRLHLDSADDWAVQTDDKTDNCGGRMKKFKGYEVEDAVYDMLTSMTEELIKMKGKKDSLESDALTQVTAQRDILQGKIDELNQQLATKLDADDVTAAAEARLNAYNAAQPYLKEPKFDAAIEPIEWKRRAIAAARPSLKLDGKEDAYIVAAFDMLTELGLDKQQQTKAVKATLDEAARGGNRDTPSLTETLDDDEQQVRADIAAIDAQFSYTDGGIK